jgi:membrane fusion protein (multidrug efflux system)
MAQEQSTATVTLVHPRSGGENGPAASGAAAVTQPATPQSLANPPANEAKAAQTAAAPAAQKPKRSGIRRLVLPIIILGAIAYGGRLGYNYFVEGRFIVETDDAYVGADTAVISAKIAGHVVDVPVANNQAVKKGDLLVKIDPVDYQLAVDAAKNKVDSQNATIARVARQVEAQQDVIAGAQAQLDAAQAQLDGSLADARRASLQFDRSQKLTGINVGSEQQLETATADKARAIAAVASSHANIANAQASLAASKANLDVLKAQQVEAERQRAELQTALDKAMHDESFTEIRAPFDGVVGNKAVVVGQYAQPGTRLLALVEPATTYVDANMKETQLENIQVGQKVDVAIDARGGATVPGVVQSIAPGSGAQFSLLPPDNATGNFTKVVQRVAVRIALSPEDVKATHLVPGLSVVASVHTRDESLPKPTLLGALADLGLDLSPKSRTAK